MPDAGAVAGPSEEDIHLEASVGAVKTRVRRHGCRHRSLSLFLSHANHTHTHTHHNQRLFAVVVRSLVRSLVRSFAVVVGWFARSFVCKLCVQRTLSQLSFLEAWGAKTLNGFFNRSLKMPKIESEGGE